ncbi:MULTISPECIES: phage tail tube protein [unclassified Oceanobacter]|uniref:phage tail tube protein n=2 Tax=Gammaproteobacteria TaxID=1236 RepID=UPI002736B47D|nr:MULTISPECIES: phage tail tube protein [unclassified Oceanobacter]MDP2548481.1 phage tail tube protein [Oceanobacter sp. 4_MG-2023]MDP2607944.1 phage tail tube protein [Oceanobacter sp. 1_MG-2023]MDP2611394.1 phage tail tube protein [Oceanobacter sp. 2_MG-2023]
MAKVAKKVIIDLPDLGRVDSINNSGSFQPGGTKRNPVTTDTGAVHYDEETLPSKVSFKLPNLPGYLEGVRDLAGINVNVQDDNGQAWIMTGAFTVQPSELQNGEISVELQGSPAESI